MHAVRYVCSRMRWIVMECRLYKKFVIYENCIGHRDIII